MARSGRRSCWALSYDQVMVFIDLIRRRGRKPQFLEFLTACCSCNGEGVPSKQEMVCTLIFGEEGEANSKCAGFYYGDDSRANTCEERWALMIPHPFAGGRRRRRARRADGGARRRERAGVGARHPHTVSPVKVHALICMGCLCVNV